MLRHFYLDASAVAKRYVPEPGALVIDHLFAQLTPTRMLVLNIGTADLNRLLV